MSEYPKPMGSTLPLTGKLVGSIIANFCAKGDDEPTPRMSIGVARNSIVATDGHSAIHVGDPADEHEATDWREAVTECTESSVYGRPFDFDHLPRLTDDAGEVLMMATEAYAIRTTLAQMVLIAKLSPDALMTVCKQAKAAGANLISLFQPTQEGRDLIGCRFAALPDEHDPEWGKAIEFECLVSVERVTAAKPKQYSMALPEDAQAESETEPKKKQPEEAALTVVAGGADAAEAPELVDVAEERDAQGLKLPALNLLDEAAPTSGTEKDRTHDLIHALGALKVTAEPVKRVVGPTVTQYQVKIGRGISVKKVHAMEADMQMALAAHSVRIQAPIPGTHNVGIEVPNTVRTMVSLRQMLERKEFWDGHPLTCAVGIDINGSYIYQDLTKLPHLLIGGATNSGKSIGLATLITSLLVRNSPKTLRMVMIDPKRVELSLFDHVPHLLCPVVKDVKEAPGILRAILREMDLRYELCSKEGVRNIDGWNAKVEDARKFPYIVVVIDELADLMLQARDEVETSIVRIAQLARAVGIHLVVATQRPSVDIVTGLIKGNVPSRMAFSVSSGTDSRVILDTVGAETLVGRGDMLFNPIDQNHPLRIQGPYVSEGEIARIVSHWKAQDRPQYTLIPAGEHTQDANESDDARDDLVDEYRKLEAQ